MTRQFASVNPGEIWFWHKQLERISNTPMSTLAVAPLFQSSLYKSHSGLEFEFLAKFGHFHKKNKNLTFLIYFKLKSNGGLLWNTSI